MAREPGKPASPSPPHPPPRGPWRLLTFTDGRASHLRKIITRTLRLSESLTSGFPEILGYKMVFAQTREISSQNSLASCLRW